MGRSNTIDSNECLPPPATNSAADCNEEKLTFPTCQIGSETYVDVDGDAQFTIETDLVLNEDGVLLAPDEVEERLAVIPMETLTECFYRSATRFFGCADDWIRYNGLWPENFTIITGSRNASRAHFKTLSVLCDNIVAMKQQRDFWDFLQRAQSGIPIYFEDRSYLCRKYGACETNYDTDAKIGEVVAFVFDPDTVETDASHRYLINFETNLWWHDREKALENVGKIAEKYHLLPDHVHYVGNPLSKEQIREGLRQFVQSLPVAEHATAEVMIIYTGHGGPLGNGIPNNWQTEVHDGFLWFNEMMTKAELQQILLEELPRERVKSVLFIVISCYSDLLLR